MNSSSSSSTQNWMECFVGKKAVANALGVIVSTLKHYPDFPAHRRGATTYVAPGALEVWVEGRETKRCPSCGVITPSGTSSKTTETNLES